MSRKAGRRHLKRLAAPRSWGVKRDVKWATKPKPGKHPTIDSMALSTVLRDVLKVAQSNREAKKIIKSGSVTIDGRVVTKEKTGVGFMDVISMPAAGKNFRMIYDQLGRISPVEIDSDRAKFKLCKITGKTPIANAKIQLNLHDARNIITDQKLSIGDVLKISIPEQKVIDSFELKEGNLAFVTKGKHAGSVGRITEVQSGTASREALAVIDSESEGAVKRITTPKNYLFVIGKKEPEILLWQKAA